MFNFIKNFVFHRVETCRFCQKQDQDLPMKTENHQTYHFHLDCYIRNIVKEKFKMEWISIKEKLPENYQYVLVFGEKEGTEPEPISIARQFKGVWEMLSHQDQSNACACGDLTWYMDEGEITHWMPIPHKPDKEKKEKTNV